MKNIKKIFSIEDIPLVLRRSDCKIDNNLNYKIFIFNMIFTFIVTML